MSDWPVFDACGVGTALTGSLGASATPHTKGSYTQLSAASPTDICGVQMNLSFTDLSTDNGLVDVAIGAAASEQVVIPNLLVSGDNQNRICSELPWLPLNILNGTRVAGRMQSAAGSAFSEITVAPTRRGLRTFAPVSRYEACGIDTANSRGTAIATAGGTVELIAATTRTFRWIMVALQGYLNTDVGFFYKLRVGAAGVEQAVMQFTYIWRAYSLHTYLGAPCLIPAGSRLSVETTFLAGGSGPLYTAAYGGV